jgi:hypothetical protein
MNFQFSTTDENPYAFCLLQQVSNELKPARCFSYVKGNRELLTGNTVGAYGVGCLTHRWCSFGDLYVPYK